MPTRSSKRRRLSSRPSSTSATAALVRFIDEHKNRTDGGTPLGSRADLPGPDRSGPRDRPGDVLRGTRAARRHRGLSATRRSCRSSLRCTRRTTASTGHGRCRPPLRREKQVVIGRDQTAWPDAANSASRACGAGKFGRTTIADETAQRPADLVDRQLPRRAAGPAVGRRPDLHPHLGRLRLPRPRHRCVQSPDCSGWALTTHMRTDLPLEALEMAIWTRRRQGVDDLTGLVHHGDRGSV